MNNLFFYLLVGLCATFISCEKKSSSDKSLAEADSLKVLLDEFTRSYDVPAMAVAIIKPDTIISGVAGVRNVNDTTKVTINDTFFLASNTKSVTATAIAHYVYEEIISWNLTPIDVWPALKEDIHSAYHEITLEQLLSNHAGILPFTSGSEWRDLPDLDSLASEDVPKAFALYLLSQKPPVQPGSQFLYSNGGFAIASEMVEQVVGKSWEEYVEATVFDPLNLNAGFGHPASDDPDQPWGHWGDLPNDRLVAYNPEGSYSSQAADAAAGAVHMSINDYAIYLQQHLRGLNSLNTKILDSETFKKLHESRGGISDSTSLPGYALGWAIAEMDGYKASIHSGSDGRFKARATIIPDKNIAIAVLVNSGTDAADQAVLAITDSLVHFHSSIFSNRDD